MNCPDEVADILLEILRLGLLRIRSLAWAENPVRCGIEADHLHNLPHLVAHFSQELLRFYWETERPAFTVQCSPEDLLSFSPLRERLARYLQPVLVR